MKLILFCLITLPLFSVAQQIATINVTPNLTSVVQYKKIVASADGNIIFLFGNKGKELVTLKNDGVYWKNIPVRNVLNYIDDAVIQNNGYMWVTNYHKANSDLFILGPNPWTTYKLDEISWKPITTMGSSKEDDLLIAGKFSTKKGTAYILRNRETKSTTWAYLTSKKVEPEIDQLFETNTIKKVTGGFKENVFIELQQPDHTTLIIYWNGKQWKQVSEKLNGVAQSMVVDGSGNLFLSGNYTTAEGKDCLLKWNGKTWFEIVVEGFLKGSPKTLIIDKNNLLLVGGNTENGYRIVEGDGTNGWQVFGDAPMCNGQMVYNGTSIFVIGSDNKNVYMVPKGGSVTLATSQLQEERKDNKAQLVYDLFLSYSQESPSYLDQVLSEWVSYGKEINQSTAKALWSTSTSANSNFFIPYLDNLAKLELQQGDNEFADYFKDLMSSHYHLVNGITYAAKYAQNMYYNNTDWQRDKEYVNKLMQQASNLSKQMDLRVRAFTKRNGISLQDAVAVKLTPDANTEALWKLYNDFVGNANKVKGVTDNTAKRVVALSTNDLLQGFTPEKSWQRDLIKQLSYDCTNEAVVLSRCNFELSKYYSNLQPAAAAFAQSLRNYNTARNQLLDAWEELGSYLVDTRFTKEEDVKNYVQVCAQKFGLLTVRYNKYISNPPTLQKAIDKFRASFGF